MARDILNGERSVKSGQIRSTGNRSTSGGRELKRDWFQKRYRVAQITGRELKFAFLCLMLKALFGFLFDGIPCITLTPVARHSFQSPEDNNPSTFASTKILRTNYGVVAGCGTIFLTIGKM